MVSSGGAVRLRPPARFGVPNQTVLWLLLLFEVKLALVRANESVRLSTIILIIIIIIDVMFRLSPFISNQLNSTLSVALYAAFKTFGISGNFGGSELMLGV